MVQHTSFLNGKNSHIRKKMHQSLPEHLQIRTQRIQKIHKKQKNIRLSQHPPHRLSHPKTNKEPLRASREDKKSSLIFGCLFPNDAYFKNTLLTGYIPPEAFLYLDERNYLQDQNNIPIIYHMQRKIV